MMHAIKGGWIGQTYALAKHNESEGKKIRIRRSKEERKTMVESFIKKYQCSNNGNFPSLNLTHKEVGGSFYTVREIVREIIQENRVLGPAKLFSEELNTTQFNEDYPLGTISTELQTPPDTTSNGSPFVPSHQKGDNEEHPLDTISTELQTLDMTSNGSTFVPSHPKGNNKDQVSISGGPYREHENQMFDNEQIINESQVDANNEESDNKTTYEELQTLKSLETDKGVESLEAPTAKVSPITADVVVETFPPRPVPKTADYSSTTYGVKNSTETLEKNVIEKVNLEAGNDSVPLVQIHSSKNLGSVGGKNVSILADVAMDKKSDIVNSKVVEKIAGPELKSSDCSTKEGGTVPDTVIGRSIEVEVSHSDVLTPEITEENQGIDRTKEINAPKGKILDGTYGSGSGQESKAPKENVIVKDGAVPSKETSPKGSNPTVDRINLESWERASRNSSEMETNPLVAIFKSIVTAFVKFWSE